MHLRDLTRQSVAVFVEGNQPLNLGILVLFLLATTLPHCQGTGMFEVHFLDYANPGQRDSQNGCCSGQEVGGSCSSPCRTFFSVCLRPLTATYSCVFGQKSTEVLGNSSFVLPSNSLLQIPWPGSLQSWPGSFSLLVAAKHKGVSSSVLIEQAVVKRQFLLPGPQWHNVSHAGSVANISFSYRVICQKHYYGDSCSTYCRPRNDHNGHFTCDSSGARVCLPGWTSSYCTKAICSVGCDPIHGSCFQPNTCNCEDGWKGQNCTQCKTHPACLHGTCNKPWDCNCNTGWGGQYCDLDLEYCARRKPCKNGALCRNVRAGQYSCTCKKGYTGRNCEREINECSSNPCFNGGSCTDLIGDFNCSCPEGYSGKQCYPDCVPGACKNGGTCMNGIRGFSCICKAGFSGSSCEEALPTTHPTTHPTSHPASHPTSHPASHPASTRESTTNGTVDATSATGTLPTANQTIEQSHNLGRGAGTTSRSTVIVAIVVAVLVILLLIVACVAWKFWRKRRREAADSVTAGAVESAQVNPKQIDIEGPDPKHCAGTRSGNPEIIRNFVASKQHEKNTNKTQESLGDEKTLKGKEPKENVRTSLELSDITTTTTTTTSSTSRTTRMNLDELYLPNRCYDQGFWQEVELEI